MKGNIIGQGGLTLNEKPIERTFIAYENITKNDVLELSNLGTNANGRVKRASKNIEYMKDLTPTTSAQSGDIFSEKLDSTHIITAFRKSTGSYPLCHVATVNPLTLEYTPGVEFQIQAIACTITGLVVLSPIKAVVTYETSSMIYARVLNISGTTVTASAPYTVGTSVDKSSCFKISSTKIALFWRQASLGGYSVVCDISGDTFTPGTVQNFSAIMTFNFKMILIDETKAVLSYHTYEATPMYKFKSRVINISGTTITFNTELIIMSLATYTNCVLENLVNGSNLIATYFGTSNLFCVRVNITNNTLTLGTIKDMGTNYGDANKSIPINNTSILLIRTNSTMIVLNVFSDTDISFGKCNYSEPASIVSKVVINFNDVDFIQVYGTNGSFILVRYAKGIKYVGAIAMENAVVGANVRCLTFIK